MKTIGNIFTKKFPKKSESNFDSSRRHRYPKATTNEVFDFLELSGDWDKIIGKTLYKVTTPLKIQNKTLYILSAHPAFSQQLSMMEDQILKKIFDHFPILTRKISKILFKTNSSHFKNEKETEEKKLDLESYKKNNKLNKFSPKYRAYNKEAQELFKNIDDNELKESLSSIYIQNKISND